MQIAKDVDGYGLSNYMKVTVGRLVHASPWDFDLAYNFDCYPGYFVDVETGDEQPYATGWNVKNGRTFAKWIGADGSPHNSTMVGPPAPL